MHRRTPKAMLTLRERLIERVLRLPTDRLDEATRLLDALEEVAPAPPLPAGPVPILPPSPRPWPHAPLHRLSERGTYIVTGGTMYKQLFFRDTERLTYLEDRLLTLAHEHGWQLEAWAVFANHYHFVAHALADCQPLDSLLKHLHGETATEANRWDATPARHVWYNFWETALTFETSYLARLNYVHQNAVKHGLVPVANRYRWCSAAWFERTATPAQVKTIYSFKTDGVHVFDDFDVLS